MAGPGSGQQGAGQYVMGQQQRIMAGQQMTPGLRQMLQPGMMMQQQGGSMANTNQVTTTTSKISSWFDGLLDYINGQSLEFGLRTLTLKFYRTYIFTKNCEKIYKRQSRER